MAAKPASIKLSHACDGFLRYKTAVGKSLHTISDYANSLKKLRQFFRADPPLTALTRDKLITFFAWLQDDYISEPDGVAPRGKIKLSAKSILNIHTALSSLWSWAVDEGFVTANVLRSIEPPAVSEPIIETLTREEVEAMLKVCENSRTWKTRADTANARPTAGRDQAIIRTLLDTGARAEELCGMAYGDVNLSNNSIRIRGKGPGRDPKERQVYFGKRTGQALWKFLTPRLDTIKETDPVFSVGSDDPRPLTGTYLARLIHRLGERASVKGAHPHQFRHTFAINYLRNGGDLLTLQALLGHSSLDMVKRYARVAQTDCQAAHRQASPVDRWKL